MIYTNGTVCNLDRHSHIQLTYRCIVWHGSQEKYQRFDQIGGRFNSEFGMAAFPVLQTIKEYVTNEKDLYPQSRVLDFHNKADGHERRIGAYVLENFHNSSNLAVSLFLL